MYTISRSLNTLPRDELEKLAHSGVVNLGWWNSYGVGKPKALSQYADGFFTAARDLLDRFLEKQARSDVDSLPIFYLIFHFIELSLKASIEAKLEWGRLLGQPLKEPPRSHNITGLLSYLTSLFEPGEEFLSEETQAFILKMDDLSGRSAQAFRYPFDKSLDKFYWEDRPVLSIGILRAEFAIHGGELNGFQSWLCYREDESDGSENYSDESYD